MGVCVPAAWPLVELIPAEGRSDPRAYRRPGRATSRAAPPTAASAKARRPALDLGHQGLDLRADRPRGPALCAEGREALAGGEQLAGRDGVAALGLERSPVASSTAVARAPAGAEGSVR